MALRILDRYILKTIIWPIIFCVYTLILLFLVADLFDNLSEILANGAPLSTVLRYYSLLIPFAFSQTIAWAVFLGTIFIFTTFSKHHELVAMKAAGLEIYSIAKPLIFLGFCLSIFVFIINDRVVPPTYRLAEEIKTSQIENTPDKQKAVQVDNITLLKGDKQFFVRSMETATQKLYDVRIHYLNEKFQVTKKIVAQTGTWDNEQWTFSIIQIFELGPDHKIIGEPVFLPKHVFEDIYVTPEEFMKAGDHAPIKSMKELREFIEILKNNGLDYKAEKTELYEKPAASWMSLVIILIILPLLARSNIRKTMATRILICLGLIFAYYLTYAVALAFGKSGTLPPIIGAWSPHVIFAVAGLFFLRKANY